jgi:lysophospholipase L1-like esterase
VIVFLAGTNNIGAEQGDPEKVADITQGLKSLVDVCRAKASDATIILSAIFPRNDNMAAAPAINQINRNLERMADGQRVRYLNINPQLADESGRLFPGMMNADRLHPTVRAYQIWADALKPILTKILGPPAQTDHAPPPTGDPSAGRSRPSGVLPK